MPDFVWVRNRNAAGHGGDPMPQIIHDDVGVLPLEIVARVKLERWAWSRSISDLAHIYPAPEVQQ